MWDSSRIKAEFAPPKLQEPVTPKVIAVGGATTHYGGGPSHALYPTSSIPSATPKAEATEQSFWHDIADDLMIPKSFKLPSADIPKELLEGVAETTEMSGRKTDIHYSRTSDDDEKKGLWALLGLLVGSWVVAGLLKPAPASLGAAEPAAVAEAPAAKSTPEAKH